MTRTALLPLLAVAATAAAVPTASALAGTTPATKASIKVEGGYAYYDSFRPLNRRLVVVVVKTAGQLPRRYDGLIRAGGSLAGHGGGSIASVGGRASKCYTFTVGLTRSGRFYPAAGARTGKAAPGRYRVTMTARDADGHALTSSKTLTLRDRRPGDRSGRPLGC